MNIKRCVGIQEITYRKLTDLIYLLVCCSHEAELDPEWRLRLNVGREKLAPIGYVN